MKIPAESIPYFILMVVVFVAVTSLGAWLDMLKDASKMTELEDVEEPERYSFLKKIGLHNLKRLQNLVFFDIGTEAKYYEDSDFEDFLTALDKAINKKGEEIEVKIEYLKTKKRNENTGRKEVDG